MENQPKKKQPQSRVYLRFSGVAIQMGLIIWAGSELGKWLDGKYPNDDALYTKIITLASVFLAMYLVISEVVRFSNRSNKKEE